MFKYTSLLILFAQTTKASEDKGGMPQLNPESFSSQIFWLVLLFLILFLLNHYVFLPRLKNIRKKRDKTIQSYLDEAKKINDSINIIVEKMKKDFDNAKNTQNSLLKKTFEENKKILDEKVIEINEEFEKKKKNLNNDIERKKEIIISEFPKLCLTLSDNLYEKIMGEKNKGNINEVKKFLKDN